MTDEDGVMTEQDFDALVAKADKVTLWWALYRLLSALHSARAEDPACKGEDRRGGLYNVTHVTADHWGPQIEGMPSFDDVAREIAEDAAYHELTYAAERAGVRITGDEFIPRVDILEELTRRPDDED